MKITIETSEKELTIYTDGPFTVLVDDEPVLEHSGDLEASYLDFAKTYADKFGHIDLIGKTYSVKLPEDKASSLFSACPSQACKGTCKEKEETDYVTFDVPSSSFIDNIRWWNFDEGIGEDALEINLKDGRYVAYAGVPKDVVLSWIAHIKTGGSAGRFYNQMIKGNYEISSEGNE